MTDTANARSDVSLTMVRVLKAPRERVFDALTNPAALAAWWGPEGSHCPDPEIDLRVGGAYRLDIQAPSGQLYKLSGRYLAIEQPAKLRFTWTWTEGAYAGIETVVSIALKDHADGTELTLHHTGFTAQSMADEHKGGWAGALDSLEAYLDSASQQGD